MKPVMQNTLGRRGNCMSACLASILEIPIEAVPNFYEVAGEGVAEWWAAVRAWLKPHGFGVITLAFTDAAQWDQLCLDGYHIVSGPSPRVEGSFHATVWHEGRMVHDPHPDQAGIDAPETLDLLYPLDAAALRPHGAGVPYCAKIAGPCPDGCAGIKVQCGKPGELHGDCWRVKPPPAGCANGIDGPRRGPVADGSQKPNDAAAIPCAKAGSNPGVDVSGEPCRYPNCSCPNRASDGMPHCRAAAAALGVGLDGGPKNG